MKVLFSNKLVFFLYVLLICNMKLAQSALICFEEEKKEQKDLSLNIGSFKETPVEVINKILSCLEDLKDFNSVRQCNKFFSSLCSASEVMRKWRKIITIDSFHDLGIEKIEKFPFLSYKFEVYNFSFSPQERKQLSNLCPYAEYTMSCQDEVCKITRDELLDIFDKLKISCLMISVKTGDDEQHRQYEVLSAVKAIPPEKSVFLKELILPSLKFTENGPSLIDEAWPITNLESLILMWVSRGPFNADLVAKLIARNHNLTEIDFHDKMLDIDGIRILAKELKSCHKLKKVILSLNFIAAPGAAALAEALNHTPALELLDLSFNCFAEPDTSNMVIFSAALKKCKKLKNISMQSNHITAEGAAVFATGIEGNTCLEVLKFDNNCLEGEHGRTFLSKIASNTNLRTLVLSNNEIAAIHITTLISALEKMSNLDYLNISSNQINNASMSSLIEAIIKYNSNLTRLDISRNPIMYNNQINPSFPDIGRLHQLCKLKSLYCSGISLSDEAMYDLSESFMNHRELKSLSLCRSIISDQGLKHLADLLKTTKNLRRLYISNIKINSARGSILAGGISENKSLNLLDLSLNNMGTSFSSISEALKSNKSLDSIQLDYNNIDDALASDFAGIINAGKQFKKIDLRHNQIGDKGAIAIADAIKNSTQLKSLYLDHNNIGDSGALAFKSVIESTSRLIGLSLVENQNISQEAKKILIPNVKVGWRVHL